MPKGAFFKVSGDLMKFQLVLTICFCLNIYAHIPTKEETVIYRNQLDSRVLPKCISIPEGGFVYYYHPIVATWLEQPLNTALLQTIEDKLKNSLEIPFTKEGFTQAVSRQDQFGEVSYSAIWVRDCCWHYYGLKIHHQQDAAKLLLNLLRFYSTDQQIARFLAIIKDPKLADPNFHPLAHMQVPLIRFSSKTLSHHQFENQDQEWNHLQFDSHGLFLLALSDALSSGILLPKELDEKHFAVLALFPAFFSQTNYAEKADAGPWEEELQYNASSAGLVASGIKRIMEVLSKQGLQSGIEFLKNKTDESTICIIESAMSSKNILNLYQSGLDRVEKNLSFGGEAPNLEGGLDRKADAALLFLALVEHSLFFDNPKKIKEILNINSALIGPYGIYRYRYDPYQTCNYWINFDLPSPILGTETTLFKRITSWQKGYMPDRQSSDAQWFFDSFFAVLYYHLSEIKEGLAKAYYLRQGDIHLKRALAQLTGPNAYSANGEPVNALEFPESINTVFDFASRPLPSPICPLNWAKAAMQMALQRAKSAHAQFEQTK